MADKENQLCNSTRASRKRNGESTEGLPRMIKKRVALGELSTNISPNVSVLNLNSGPGKTQKQIPDPDPKKEEVGAVVETTVNTGNRLNVDPGVGPVLENQLCNSTRASRKRNSESTEGLPRMIKKRVALGELSTNIAPNVSVLNLNSGPGKTQKQKPYPDPKKEEVGAVVETTVNAGSRLNVDPGVGPVSNELQKFGYASLIYQHLHSLEMEVTRRPLSNYMEKVQKDIRPVMREVLVDWLVEVAEQYKLVSDTLYLTVNYIDRYLSSHVLIRNKLQLLGVSCMLIAGKFEEISPPHIEDFCYITDNTYTKEEVVHMEREVLKFLDFKMGNPTTKAFLRILTRAAQEEPMFTNLQFDFLCCYLAELSLLDYRSVGYTPSIVAASAIFLSRLTLRPSFHPWSLALQQYTGYKPFELKGCVLRLHNLQLKAETSIRAVRQKYMDHKFKCVALLNPPLEVPVCYFEVSNE